jgi:hypothetical protein
MDKKRWGIVLLFCCSIFFMFGCTAHRLKSYEKSGFLGDYSGLVEGERDQPNMVYTKPDLDLRPYEKVMIDHVVVFINPHSENKGIQPGQLAELTKYFHQALIDALEGPFQIVDAPGPGVLRIRTAITDIEPGKPVRNTMSTVIPVGMAATVVNKAMNDTNLGVGRASVEVELLDSVSNERLAAAIDRREGRKRVVSGKWTDVKKSFDYWADRLKTWLGQQKALKLMQSRPMEKRPLPY